MTDRVAACRSSTEITADAVPSTGPRRLSQGEGDLLNRLRSLVAAFGARFGWNWVGYAIGLTIVGISLYVLSHLLADIEWSGVLAAAKATPPSHIAAAILAIGGAYFTLSFYDFFALRVIGANHVPYRIAALASFTSYAIGHNIGATAFSGGAVRLRIYSYFRLGVIDVAKICFLTGLTFWIGNLVVLGSGMVYRPEVSSLILQISPGLIRAIGIAALIVLSAYILWVGRARRSFGRDGWQVTLPGGYSTLIQVGIGIADLTFSSLAMYSLVPTVPHDDFVTVAIATVSATLLGFASHAPGSLGVFDAAMLVALPDQNKEELVAALTIYRVLYFMIPFVIALLIMAYWEVTLFLEGTRGDGKRTSPQEPLDLAPKIERRDRVE
jgi:glycosyltransferase 2 family protein